MTVVVLDMIESARWREVHGKVREIVRVAIVSEIGGSVGGGIGQGAPKADKALAKALGATGIPQPGAVHPNVPGLFLRERQVIGVRPSIAFVELVYRLDVELEPPDGDSSIVSGGSGLVQIRTALDANGNQITVSHNGIVQGGEIDVRIPLGSLRFRRREKSSAPGTTQRMYAGRVNSVAWDKAPSDPPRSWLCTDVGFELENRETTPPTYAFEYVFEHAGFAGTGVPEVHDPQIVFRDRETGEPPVGLVANQGYKTVPYYPAADFNALAL